jgi:alkyldihydroxyacetonephosphate synthase
MIQRDVLRWNGWGRLGESTGFSRRREEWLLSALGTRLGRELGRAPDPVSLDAVRLPPEKISSELLAELRRICGEEDVRTSAFERVTHALGRSLPDLLRLREGGVDAAPDVVVYPRDEGAVATVLRLAASARMAVVPVGGGTSVVGGIEPRPAPGQAGVIALDTTHLDALLRLDEDSGLATFQAGIDGPALEQELAEHDLTLGHFPQSFEHSTLGGWIATRSTGQLSDHYGGIEDLVVSVRVVTPEGVLRTALVPRSATGPDLNALVLGSEGVLGVIVEATVRVRRRPRASEVRGLLLRDFEDGVELIRRARRAGLPLSMVRLSDAPETALFELLRRDPARRIDVSALGLALAVAPRASPTSFAGPFEPCAPPRGAGRRFRSARVRVAPGSMTASARPTFATGCSTTASRSTRSRPRCLGAGWRTATGASAAHCGRRSRDMPAGASPSRTSPTPIWTAPASTSR